MSIGRSWSDRLGRGRALFGHDIDDGMLQSYDNLHRAGVMKEGLITRAKYILFRKYPNQSKIESKAHRQPQSWLLERLPLELREQIYMDIWRDAGLTQHIFIHPKGGYTHSTCVTDHHAPDSRQVEIDRFWSSRAPSGGFLKDALWNRRLGSTWCNHWSCEELAVSHITNPKPTSPFLPMLLSCSMMYIECRYSIYKHITFAFTRFQTALDYLILRKSPGALAMQNICFSFLFPTIGATPEDQRSTWKREIAPWQQLCAGLTRCTQLRRVDIWVDSLDHRCRKFLMRSPELFTFDSRLSSIITINLPAREANDLRLWSGHFSVIRRDYPIYHWFWAEVSTYEWELVVHRGFVCGGRRRIVRCI
ncbi:hypothetical protein BX600DRAFT_447481 [Xylariales sp. PMI_506]|nr:hypothetical protein BX600DRAFT_447481 [Xylariales sp. PMI_506]